MTSIIKLHALSGVFDTSPPCYLLQVDDFKFLLDCGWDETFNEDIINELSKLVPVIDAVLLSHPDPQHLGCLPYLVGKCNLNCPIYATSPVCKMGEMFMYDLHQSKHNYEEFTLFTLDDIDLAFEKIIQLKYNQSFSFKGKGYGLVITPLPSGHKIGGTIWKIIKDNEEDIIYAIDYNHKKERHLNGCYLDNIMRPSLLITDCYNVNYKQERRKDRDEQLMTNILSTFRQGGNVLIAVDTAGRVLELSHMLDQLWRTNGSGLSTYSLAMLNTVSYNVIEFAKSQVEWMSDKIMKLFETQRNNPFNFKHLKLLHNINELDKIKEPIVVLASQPDLESGFARELFIKWSINPKNSIILTQRSYGYTLTRKLIDLIQKNSIIKESVLDNEGKLITVEIKERVFLEGKELAEYEERIKLEKEKKYIEDKIFKNDNYDSDDDEESEEKNTVLKEISIDKTKKNVQKSTNEEFFKQSLISKKSFPMYPLIETKIKWDEYGEMINPKDFVIFEKTENNETLINNENIKTDEEFENVKEIPTKCVLRRETFSINASIQFIDFEGRSDGESIKKIIERIKPRRLILVRGDEQAMEFMRNFSYNTLGLPYNKIFTPRKKEIVDATTERNIYQVKLKDSLVSSLRFSKAKDGAELCWIEAAIELNEDERISTDNLENDKIITLNKISSSNREILPILRPLEQNQMSSHVTIFVNELKLSDFKQVLVRNGIQAEFHGGVLYINNKVCVRRNEAGRITLEGTICEDYFKVRHLLYEQYAII